MTDRGVALEIGPGLGQFTANIARRVAKVHALEVVPGQARFTLERCRQEGADNVEAACGSDDCLLPYGDEMFDVVILNLVFEWCGSRDTGVPAQLAQRRMLQEIYRVLKSGGNLYLATKNRFALQYVMGHRDAHAQDVHFGNALPRWLLALLLRMRGKVGPQGVLYSHRQLASLLRGARFSRIKSFWAVPEMRFSTQYVATDAASIRAARRQPQFVQGEIRRTKLIMPWIPAAMVRHGTPGLAFLAEKG